MPDRLIDYCVQHGHRLGLVMAAAAPITTWLANNSAGMSRTVRCEKSENMTVEEMLAILCEWVPAFKALVAQAKSKDEAAIKLARVIHRATGDGNFRRMTYFASLLRQEKATDESTIKVVLARIALIPSK